MDDLTRVEVLSEEVVVVLADRVEEPATPSPTVSAVMILTGSEGTHGS